MSKAKWEHLVRNVPNTEENRKFIKDVNKMSKESDSCYKLFIKYRKPKEGFKYGSGGSLKCENANAFSVYIADRRPYGSRPIDHAFNTSYERGRKITKLEDKITELRAENDKLKKELSLFKNPYYQLSEDEIYDAIIEIKEDIFCRFIDRDKLGSDTWINAEKLIEKYDQLVEALNYEKENN